MKKKSVNEMIKMGSCNNINCWFCPFNDEDNPVCDCIAEIWADAHGYRHGTNVDDSKVYIAHLKKKIELLERLSA